ncbi:MAG: hypothetical protein M3Y42_18670 [Actinomycetota bacterium]|nr:hypothetical protein [Actinomycetota bacterium]
MTAGGASGADETDADQTGGVAGADETDADQTGGVAGVGWPDQTGADQTDADQTGRVADADQTGADQTGGVAGADETGGVAGADQTGPDQTGGVAGAGWPDQLRGVIGIRVARDTTALRPLAEFYRDRVGLVEQASFLDHAGYDGVIFRLPVRSEDSCWLQWELTQGPEQPAHPHGGWELLLEDQGGTSSAATDPDGFGCGLASVPSQGRPRFRRPSARPVECRDFYGGLLGLRLEGQPERLIVQLPDANCLLQLDQVAEAGAIPPTAEDLLVFFFRDRAARDHAADLLAAAGARSGAPENPWWHGRARCFADPDGFLLALAYLP